jgi:predicted enzyme related to lactoylglutathione lyase
MHGFCHAEIPTTDAKKSQEFYGKVFGWKFEETPDDYVTFRPPEGLGGGFTKMSRPSKDGVVLYIEVADIDKKLGEIEQSGGKRLVQKTKISDEFGFYALFLDPCGNSVGLWSKQ